mgnify:FL=1
MLRTPNVRMILSGELSRSKLSMATFILNRRNELLHGVLGNVEKFEAIENKILADRFMSDEGKRVKLTEEATKALDTFKGFASKIQDVEDNLRQLRNRLFVVERPKGTEIVQLRQLHREQEIRAHYEGLTQSELDVAFLNASEQDRDETLLAFLDAPWGPMVNEDIKGRALDARAKRVFPKDYEIFKQNEGLLEILNMVRDSLATWLRGLGVKPEVVDGALLRDATIPLMAGEPPKDDDPAAASKFVAARS